MHAAAAHVVGEIDAFEDRLKIARSDRHPGDEARLDQFAAALIARFGERAVEISHKQLCGAEGDVLLSWAAIIARLGVVGATIARA